MVRENNIIYKKWFKFLLICLMFIPVFTEIKYDSQNTTKVIAEILMNPFIIQLKWLLPITKIILLLVVLTPIIMKKKSEKVIFGYYALMLIIVGIFQNMGNTNYGYSFIIGNLIVQFIIAGFVIYDLIKGKSIIDKNCFDKKSLWILPLMLLAFLMPYTINNGIINPSLKSVLYNEAGVTYCMFTPVIVGVLILFNKKVYKPTLNAISFLGFGFGILNMMTWFILNLPNWWMGICHLPLLIISFYGLKKSKKSKISTFGSRKIREVNDERDC